MAKKVKIDIEEMERAMKEFQACNLIDTIHGDEFLRLNISDNWDGDAARQFLSRMHDAYVDKKELVELSKALKDYCALVKIEAWYMDSWLRKFIDYITFWD